MSEGPFVREEERARLSAQLRRPDGPRALVLFGFAGVGKTALADRLAEDLAVRGNHRQHWSGWADVTLVRLYGRLGASRQALVDLMELEGDTYPAVRDAVRARLTELPGCVAVFDDVPSAQAVEELLAAFEGTEATALFTSRAPLWPETPSGYLAHHVALLDAESSAVVAGRPNLKARDVHATTGGLPALARMLAWRDGPLPPHPGALVRAVVDDLPTKTREALWLLRQWGLERFTEATLTQLDTQALLPLIATGVIWKVDAGTYLLPTAVRDALKLSDAPRDRSLRMHNRLDHVVAGVADQERLGDEYLDLVCRKADAWDDVDLGRISAVRLRHHQAVALKWAAGHSARNPSNARQFVAPACAAVAREIGRMEHARRELASLFPDPERALVAHQSGRLDEALEFLAGAERAGGADPFQLTTIRASVLTDQGYPAEAARLLQDATVGTDNWSRLLVWWQIERARAHLLLGEPERASGVLDRVAHEIAGRGRDRVAAWVALHDGRALLQQSRISRALKYFREALRKMLAVEDVRGQAWVHHYTGIALARTGMSAKAQDELSIALRMFQELPDELGRAWTLHQLGLISRDADDHSTAAHQLGMAAQVFVTIGCPHGSAWSELELAALEAGNRTGHLATAAAIFSRLRDRTGLLWSAYLRAALVDRPTAAPRDLLAALRKSGQITERDLAVQARQWRHADPDPLRTPYHARDTILRTDTDPFGTDSHVSLTLLDGPGTTVRLRVVPAASHPWAAERGALPWLSVVATPLTSCGIEPATSLVRPSSDLDLGAEFVLSPRGPGRHRIRFTIAHEATGTVLQQVETEIDIVDVDGEDLAGAPYPEHVRGA
ncbi:AAA family ATPase [Streptomyces sp. NPDC058740]|uniref:AAA family ATPase n=1 Tax=Streptomyces sp. NPDC058740 TaxID=3346619 RepID=UPI003693B6FB